MNMNTCVSRSESVDLVVSLVSLCFRYATVHYFNTETSDMKHSQLCIPCLKTIESVLLRWHWSGVFTELSPVNCDVRQELLTTRFLYIITYSCPTVVS